MNNIERIFSESTEIVSFAKQYLTYLSDLILKVDPLEITVFIETIFSARDRGAQIFFIGNGGSAATASHFANDITIGSRSWDSPYRAVALTDNESIVTAIAND